MHKVHRALTKQLARTIRTRRQMSSAKQLSPSGRPAAGCIRHLVVDFDQTLTTRDTLSILASASPLPNSAEVFAGLTKAYIDDYTTYSQAYPPRSTLEEEYAFLASLREVERRSIERIESSNLFKDIKRSDLQRAARKVELRAPEEFAELLQRICSSNSDSRVSVLSVNWSGEFIREVLAQIYESVETDKGASKAPGSKVDISKITIYSNNLLTAEDGEGDTGATTTGMLDRYFGTHGIWTAEDKVHILDEILEDKTGGVNNIYVGDSNTDFPALLHEKVDIGFIMGAHGENASLLKTCQRLGVSVLEREERPEINNGSTPTSTSDHDGTIRPLFRVKSWAELIECCSMSESINGVET